MRLSQLGFICFGITTLKMKIVGKILAFVTCVLVCVMLWKIHSPRGLELCQERMSLADSVIENAIARDDFPGAVLCVVGRAADGESMGDLLYLKAYGSRQVVSGKDADGRFVADTIPMTEDAVFDLASVSKCVGTTLSFMRLVEDGRVRIDDHVSRYIDDFKPWESKPERRGEEVERVAITVRHLLNHTSGLAPGIYVPSFLKRYEMWGDPVELNLRDSLVAYLAKDAARNTRPGENMRYSCLNFIALQAVVERASGERLDHYARRNVFEPLQLKNTWYNPIDESEKPFAADAPIVPTSIESGRVLMGEVHDPTARVVNRGVSGNAGLFSTAEDLAVVASMLMNGGVVSVERDDVWGKLGLKKRVRLYSQHSVDTFFALTEECRSHGRTLGWDTGSFGDLDDYERVINHTGYTGTSIQMNLDTGIAVILLTNRVHPLDDGSVGRTRALVTNIISSAIK